MILPDYLIADLAHEYDLIEPFDSAHLQPASVDLTLADDFRRAKVGGRDHMWAEYNPEDDYIDLGDLHSEDLFEPNTEVGDSGFLLWPNQFALGRTIERVNLPDYIVGRVEGKSSLGRIGLLVHCTAGFADPGFCGTITLELINVNPRPMILRPGKRICQISFTSMTDAARKPYGSEGLGSRYQDQYETTASRYTG